MKKSLWIAALALATGSSAWGLTARQIYQKCAPGVVLIIAQNPGDRTASQGAGFFISDQGLVMTNAHVVVADEGQGQPYGQVFVFLKPARLTGNMAKDLRYQNQAEIEGYDASLDLALLKVKDFKAGEAPATQLGDSNGVQPGDQALAIGHPEQGGFWTLTSGVISGERNNFEDVPGKNIFQEDTSINRGNSGGPLLDEDGHVIGVNTAIARKAADGLAITGISFSLRSSVVKKWLGSQGVELAYAPEAQGEGNQSQAAAPADSGKARAEAQPTEAPTAQEQAKAQPTEAPTAQEQAKAQPTEAPTVQQQASAGSSSGGSKEARHKQRIVMDLDQTERSYSSKNLNSFFQQIVANRDKAVDELDQDVQKMHEKEDQEGQ